MAKSHLVCFSFGFQLICKKYSDLLSSFCHLSCTQGWRQALFVMGIAESCKKYCARASVWVVFPTTQNLRNSFIFGGKIQHSARQSVAFHTGSNPVRKHDSTSILRGDTPAKVGVSPRRIDQTAQHPYQEIPLRLYFRDNVVVQYSSGSNCERRIQILHSGRS